jgi:hypothetical protein
MKIYTLQDLQAIKLHKKLLLLTINYKLCNLATLNLKISIIINIHSKNVRFGTKFSQNRMKK